MPIWLRKFTYQQIVEAKQKEAEAMKGRASKDGKKNIDLANPNLADLPEQSRPPSKVSTYNTRASKK